MLLVQQHTATPITDGTRSLQDGCLVRHDYDFPPETKQLVGVGLFRNRRRRKNALTREVVGFQHCSAH